jgi:uncharacterized protein GlcG (DUF336 family)
MTARQSLRVRALAGTTLGLLLSLQAAATHAAGMDPAPAASALPGAPDPTRLPGDHPPPPLDFMIRPPGPDDATPPRPIPDPPVGPGLADAEALAHAALSACSAKGQAMAVVVMDSAGAIRVALSMPGTGPGGRVFSAAQKALAALEFAMPTRDVQTLLRSDPAQRVRVAPNVAVFPGGRPILEGSRVIGAIAASGSTAADDDACIAAGLAAWRPSAAAAPLELPKDMVAIPQVPADAPVASLVRDGLRLTIALPDAQRGFYRGTRFDWSGIITQASLGGAHFYGLWFDGTSASVHDFLDTAKGVIVNPNNAATGPAEEFASRDGETVPGYNAAAAGGTFIKIGVGRLRKDDAAPYDHFRSYAIVDGGTWSVRRAKDRITFSQRLDPGTDGYGYTYEKVVSLGPGGTVTIAHALRNSGTRPIHTQVYNHNFARFDSAPTGAGMAVEFPFAVTGPVSSPALAEIDGQTLHYRAALAAGDRVQLPPQPGGPDTVSGPFRVSGANGAAITVQGDTPLVRTAFWSIRRAVAIEPFVAINVEPGAEQRWSWRYTYAAPRAGTSNHDRKVNP